MPTPRRILRLLAVIAALVIQPSLPAAAGPDFGRVEAVVVRVCDGDTVVVDIPDYPDVIGKGIRVRLAGVDAPELSASDPERRGAARRAKTAMEALLPPGTRIELRGIRRDKYFRLDAAIRVGETDVADALGLAPRPRHAR